MYMYIFVSDNQKIEEWHNVFLLTASIIVFTVLFYMVFGSGKSSGASRECNEYHAHTHARTRTHARTQTHILSLTHIHIFIILFIYFSVPLLASN